MNRSAIYHGASEAARELAEGLDFFADGIDADLIEFLRTEYGTLLDEALRVLMHETAGGRSLWH